MKPTYILVSCCDHGSKYNQFSLSSLGKKIHTTYHVHNLKENLLVLFNETFNLIQVYDFINLHIMNGKKGKLVQNKKRIVKLFLFGN